MAETPPNQSQKFTPTRFPTKAPGTFDPSNPPATIRMSDPIPETAPKISEPISETSPETAPINQTHSGSDGGHLDAIVIGDEPGAPPAPAPGPATAEATAAGGFVTREIFARNFSGAFAFAGGMTGLQSLSNAPQAATCKPAADALYDTCRDTPWLNFLVKPGSLWVQRALAIGAFVVPLGREVSGEVRARRYSSPAANDAGAQPLAEVQPPATSNAGDDPAMAWGVAA